MYCRDAVRFLFQRKAGGGRGNEARRALGHASGCDEALDGGEFGRAIHAPRIYAMTV